MNDVADEMKPTKFRVCVCVCVCVHKLEVAWKVLWAQWQRLIKMGLGTLGTNGRKVDILGR